MSKPKSAVPSTPVRTAQMCVLMTVYKWLDNIRDDCKEMAVSIYEASQLVTDRTRWRNTVRDMGCQRALTTSLSPGQ